MGGTICGYASQYAGRRLAIILVLCWTACFIPLWILPNSFAGLTAGAFFLQSGVQGAWGVCPVYLGEISPPAFRASFAGIAYQLGNMVSSAAAQIETTAAENLKIPGTNTADYGKIQGILIGCVIAWMLVCVVLGPEAQGSHFENAKVSYQRGAGEAVGRDLVEKGRNRGEERHVEDVRLDGAGDRKSRPREMSV